MITISIERIINTVALTSLVTLFAPTKPSQLSTPAIALNRQPKEIAAEHRQPANVRNGIYLFSHSSKSIQITDGVNYADGFEADPPEYMVLQLEDDQVIGGFYQPLSEYTCFTGIFRGETLDLWVSIPDSPDVYAYSIPIQVQTQIASQSNTVDLSVNELVLQEAHRISALDQVSQNVLNECLIELNV